jgi:hypothetical protein
MKKFVFLIGIIAACMMSSKSFSQVTVECFGNYVTTDPNYQSGDTYKVRIEVTSLYPSTGYSAYWYDSTPGNYTLTGQTAYPVQYVDPASTNYYTMTIIVIKYYNGNPTAIRSGSSYGELTYLSGIYYLTAFNTINVTSF